MDLRAKGINGQIAFDGAIVTITREGFMGRTTHGRSAKSLAAKSIGSVQYKRATSLVNGWVQFSVSGESAIRERLGSKHQDLSKDENAILFRKSALADFDAVVAAIREAQGAFSVGAAIPDAADQIGKLAALRDSGVLTEEEFAAKKAELLSRM